MTINRDAVPVREAPATNVPAKATLNSGDSVHIIETVDEWYKVRVDGATEGWIPIWFLNDPNLPTDQDLLANITVPTQLYQSQNDKSDVLTTIESGEQLSVNYESEGWTSVSYKGQYGFVRTRLVSFISRQQIADEAERKQAERDRYNTPFDPDETAVFKMGNQAFLSEPNNQSEILYNPRIDQRFKILDTVYSDQGVEFEHVEDENGTKGYIESRNLAMIKDFDNHVSQTNAKSLSEATILLDPGHGGEDPGAESPDGTINEKIAALDTAFKLKKNLEDEGATVYMTRSEDVFVELKDRAIQSNDLKVDAFISLHFDDSPAPDWRGTTTYFFHDGDKALASALNNRIKRLSLPNNGELFGNFQVLRKNHRPAVLLELGYMSNGEDLKMIKSEEYHSDIANALRDGLKDYFNNQ